MQKENPQRRFFEKNISGSDSLVLIIDDDKDQKINQDALESVGYRVICANEPDEAIRLFSEEQPDLVVLDVLMPQVDGFELCRRMRETDKFGRTPILMLTALDDDQSVKKAYAAGASDFLHKPVNNLLLGYRVNHLLREHTAAKRLYNSELQQLTVFDTIPDPLMIYGQDLELLWINQVASNCFSKERDELLGMKAYEIWSGLDEEPPESQTRKCFETGETITGQKVTPDGVIWGVRLFPIRGVSGEVERVVEMAHNITDKVKLQEDTIRNSQLASLGELAAGVAHEINNPISGVINYSEILIGRKTLDENDLDLVKRVQREGLRVAKIVSSLLNMSRIENGDHGLLAIDTILEDVISLFDSSLRKDGIDMQIDLPASLPLIRGNKQQLQQVMINLLSNARHAINDDESSSSRKVLEVSAEEKFFKGQPMVAIHTFDNGCGIPARVLDQIMHPFFTTKPPGQGTGLGLSISHNIVREHGGLLMVDSEVNEYTRVTILLPVLNRESKRPA